jgi:predicted transposase/invertase (TIGR01784 family)
MVAQASPNIKKTVVKPLELSEDEEARLIYEAEVKALRHERARMRGAFENGVLQGVVQGNAEGKNEKALEIARNLIESGMPIEKIAAVTALSREEIEKLREDSAAL